MQTSEIVFSTVATHKVTGEVTKAELFLVEENGKPSFFVSDHPQLVKEALASDVLNPFSENCRRASVLLALIAIHGFKSFED